MDDYDQYRIEHIDALPLRSFVALRIESARLRRRKIADAARAALLANAEHPHRHIQKFEDGDD